MGWRLTPLFASRKNIVLFFFPFFFSYFKSEFLCTFCAACLWLVLETNLARAPEELVQGCSGCWCSVCWTGPAALERLELPGRSGELHFSAFQAKSSCFPVH